MESIVHNLYLARRISFRCLAYGYVVLMVWFLTFLSAGEAVCDFFGPIFDFTYQQCAIIHYSGMGIMNILVLVLFFFPWLALHSILRSLSKPEAGNRQA